MFSSSTACDVYVCVCVGVCGRVIHVRDGREGYKVCEGV